MECVSEGRLSTKRRWVKELTEEDILARTLVNDVLVGQTEDLHDARQLLLLVLSGKDGEAGVELGEDAAQGPHVDRLRVVASEDDLGGSVESTLNVGVDWRTPS